jgi:hypothetical protein
VARALGVLTPEDPFADFPGEEGPVKVAPVFLGYDYSFGGGGGERRRALERAAAVGLVPGDEVHLHADPWRDLAEWCEVRAGITEARLLALGGAPLVLVQHWPPCRELLRRLRLPAFAPWCGTLRSEAWIRRPGVKAVVYGHLHAPGSDRCEGVPCEEVSFGYPHERPGDRPLSGYLREIRVSGDPIAHPPG